MIQDREDMEGLCSLLSSKKYLVGIGGRFKGKRKIILHHLVGRFSKYLSTTLPNVKNVTKGLHYYYWVVEFF